MVGASSGAAERGQPESSIRGNGGRLANGLRTIGDVVNDDGSPTQRNRGADEDYL